MKKRILSFLCAVMLIATLFSIAITPASAATPSYDDVVEFSAAGFNSTAWTGDTSNIASSGALISAADNTTKTLTTVGSYNLGTLWASSFVTGTNNYARNGNAFTLKVGSLEAVLYEENTATGDGMSVGLVKDGVLVKKVAIGTRVAAKYLVLKYDNGTATVGYNNVTYITENVGDIDFSDVKVTVSVEGNGTKSAIAINKFTLKHMLVEESSEPESSVPESSEPDSSSPTSSAPESSTPDTDPTETGVYFIESTFNTTDWEGDTEYIAESGALAPTGDEVATLTTVNSYNLGDKWTASFKIGDNWSQSNRYGNPFRLQIGNLAAIVYEANTNNSIGATIELELDGEAVAMTDLADATGYYLTLTYDYGTATVTYGDITYLTKDVGSIDFSNAKATVSAQGNYVANAIAINKFSLKAIPPAEPVNITNGFNPELWTGHTSSIGLLDDGVTYKFHYKSQYKRTITSAQTYDLSSNWVASMKIHSKWYGPHGDAGTAPPYSLMVGGLEAILYDTDKDSSTPIRLELKANGSSLGKIDLDGVTSKTLGGYLALSYKDGIATVTYQDTVYFTEAVGSMDFSAASVVVSITGDWIDNNTLVSDFSLKSTPPTRPVNITNGFNPELWTGHTTNLELIENSDIYKFHYKSQYKRTITSAKTYDLSTDWVASMKVHSKWYKNHGSHADEGTAPPYSLAVGNLEAILYDTDINQSTPIRLELKANGSSLGIIDLDGVTSKTWGSYLTLAYKNGIATLTFMDTVYFTEDVGEIDFSEASIVVSITGDWIDNNTLVSDFSLKSTVNSKTYSRNISLGEDISINYYTPDDFANAQMRFTMNDVTSDLISGEKIADGYKFTFAGVAPQNIGDEITAEIVVNGEVIKTITHSVKEDLITLKGKTATQLGYSNSKYATMLTLIDDLLCYGGAAQEHQSYKLDALVSDGIDGSEFIPLTFTDFNGVVSNDIIWQSGSLYFDSVNKIRIKFKSQNPAAYSFKYTVNGTEYDASYTANGNNVYTIETNAIFATSFDDVYHFAAYDNSTGDEVAWLTYSVKSYVYSKQSSSNLKIAKLAKCTYMYGASAKAFAEVNTTSDFKYKLNADGTATVTGMSVKSNTAYIPETIDGHTVTAIADFAFRGLDITDLTVPSSIKFIGKYAFADCSALEHVAFLCIDAENIGEGAFQGCASLSSIDNFEYLNASIGKKAFANCAALSELSIGSGVTSIAANAFSGTAVTIKCTDGSVAHQFAVNGSITYELVTAATSANIDLSANPAEFDVVNSAVRDYMAEAATYDLTDDFSTTYAATLDAGRAPNPLTLSWSYANGFAPTGATLYISRDAKLANATKYDITGLNSISVNNLHTATTYYYRIVAHNGNKIEASAIRSVDITAGPNLFNTTGFGISNLRDVGGWKTNTGDAVKQGLVYRSAKFDALTDAGRKFLLSLGIRTDMDFRWNNEIAVEFRDISPLGEDINRLRPLVGSYTEAFKYSDYTLTAMQAFADIENYPILFHCAGGADRTGTIALLLNGLLGVDDHSLIMDYEFTSGRTRPYGKANENGGIYGLWTAVQSYEGATTQQKVYTALRSIGMTEMELSNIYNIMMTDSAIFANTSLAKKAATNGSLTLDIIMRASTDIASVTVGGNAVGYSFADGVLTVNAGNATGLGVITFDDGSVLRFEI